MPTAIEIRLLGEPASYQGREGEVRRAITAATTDVAKHLTVSETVIEVRISDQAVIPGFGLGGFTPSANLVQLNLNPASLNEPATFSQKIPYLVAHELHHACRWRTVGYGKTLLESLVSEGLADRFAVEVTDQPLQAWSNAFPESRNRELWERANSSFSRLPYDHAKWFFNDSDEWPTWGGYTLGYRMVLQYQRRHPSRTAASLVDVSASEFRLMRP